MIALIVILMKLVPWSLIKILGHPNIVIYFSNKKHVVFSTLQSFMHATSSHIVKYYVAVIIFVYPYLFPGGLIGPTKSISHSLNTYKVTCGLRGISSYTLRLPPL
jgi:hypothetical protein